MQKNGASIRDNIYTDIDKSVHDNLTGYKAVITSFMAERNKELFSTIPIDRIYYRDSDRLKMFNCLKIDTNKVDNAIANTYYGQMRDFNPVAAKDPLTIVMMNVIRHFLQNKDTKNAEVAAIYLAFSGKFYPSIHYASYQKFLPTDYIMEYVVNNSLNNKFVLKSQGSVFGAVSLIVKKWLESYVRKFKVFEDEDIVYMIMQLHSRIRSFMINIARAYYKAYENKDYMTYNSDNINPEEDGGKYHLATSDSFKAEKCVQKTMSYLVSSGIDYRLCKMSSNENVHTEEIKSIMETLLNDKQNLVSIRRVISILVYSYFAESKDKNVLTMGFVAYCITPKPNTKDENIIELRDTIDRWLNDTSALYRKRKHRLATRNNYNKAVLMYLAMSIFNANK